LGVAGEFSTMSMADLIQWARTAQRTGLLKLADEHGKEIRLVFRDGRIVFSSSKDKRERLSGYLLYFGLCSEEDLEAAFRIQQATGAALASVLVREKKITREQALATLTEKTMEDVCDVFLWPDGSFDFEAVTGELKTAYLTIDIDPIQAVWEGLRRADIWNRMNAYIHPTSFYEATDDPFPDDEKWEDARVARHVLPKIDGNVTVGELVERLPFSRYKIYRSISELLSYRLIRRSDVTGIVDREKRVQRKLDDARRAAQAGRWTEAMEMLNGLASANPGRADIVEQLIEVTREFERSIHEHNFTRDDVPVVTIGADALSRLNIEPAGGFLLSRIDGRLRVRDILKISAMKEFDGLRAMKRLLSAKVIDFPHRKGPQDVPAAAAVMK
jgi:hypothetical protein